MRGNNNRIVKRANRYLILDTLRFYDEITLEDIVRKTKLSYPTVRNLVMEMIKEDIVKKVGFAESSGGRQPALLQLNSTSFFSMGMDIAVTCVRLAISDLKGKIIYSRIENFDEDASKMDVLNFFIKLCEDAMNELQIPREKVAGLGIGVPGIIDTTKNISVFVERIEDWKTPIEIVKIMEERLGIKVHIRNDVHLLGLVEKYLYVPNTEKSFVYIAIRNGIGMAVFIDGELYEGKMGNAGYIGHMKMDIEGRECVCGKRGCLETFVNSKYLIEEYIQKKKKRGINAEVPVIQNDDYVGFFIEKTVSGDEDAKEILVKAGNVLGIGIANVIKTLDCTHVIIGGVHGDIGGVFMNAIQNAVRNNINDYIMDQVKIDVGKLLYQSAALGGCFLAIEDFFMEPKLNLSVN